MKFLETLHRLRTTRTLLIAGGVSLALSGGLMYSFTQQIRDVKETALPAALALPSLEKRLALLQQQADIGELQEALGTSSPDEKVRMYVLPPHDEIDRLIHTMDLFLGSWQKQRSVTHVTPLSVGTATGVTLDGIKEPLFATPIYFEADVTKDGLDRLMRFIHIAGFLTVDDAFDEAGRSTLLRLTEEENPAAVTALEQFLATDLLSYVRDPAAAERNLLRAFASDTFADSFRQVLDASELPKIEDLFSKDIAATMDDQRLWPVRMLRIKGLTVTPVTDDLSHVAISLEALSRGQ